MTCFLELCTWKIVRKPICYYIIMIKFNLIRIIWNVPNFFANFHKKKKVIFIIFSDISLGVSWKYRAISQPEVTLRTFISAGKNIFSPFAKMCNDASRSVRVVNFPSKNNGTTFFTLSLWNIVITRVERTQIYRERSAHSEISYTIFYSNLLIDTPHRHMLISSARSTQNRIDRKKHTTLTIELHNTETRIAILTRGTGNEDGSVMDVRR